jgi:N-acetylneuraminic acid mutarotase
MSTSRVGHTATVLPNGKVLVVGGVPIGMSGVSVSASADLYDPATNTWSAAASTSVGRSLPTATLLLSGKVLVAGGLDSTGTPLASAELYDPATNSWSAAGSMAHQRSQYCAALLPSGKVLVAGGDVGGLNGAELYDPGTNTWSVAGSMAQGRTAFTATLLPNGQVLAAAGGGPGGDKCAGFIAGQTPLCSAELYDPATNLWTATGMLTDSRGFDFGVLLQTGKVLVAGGDNGDPNLNGGVPTLAELYHP